MVVSSLMVKKFIATIIDKIISDVYVFWLLSTLSEN